MSKKKTITWDDLRKYKKLSNRKKSILTNDFLNDFRNELIDIFAKNGDARDLTKETYWSFYSWIEGSYGFDKALKIACNKHNLTKAIYEYQRNMLWYESDAFSGDLTRLMVERGIIVEGYIESDFDVDELNQEDIKRYKVVEYKKGYNVVRFDWCFVEDIKFIENLYSDDTRSLVWL